MFRETESFVRINGKAMQIFKYVLIYTKTVVVDALDSEEAKRIGSVLEQNHHGGKRLVGVVEASTDERTVTFICSRCGKSSLKECWGPGRIRCPECGEVERSASEWQQHLENERISSSAELIARNNQRIGYPGEPKDP